MSRPPSRCLQLPGTISLRIRARRGSGSPNTDASAPCIALLGGEAATPAGGSALGRRGADRALDGRKKRVEPDRLRHAAMALAALARQFRQIAAHDKSLGAKIGCAIGNDRAVAIRQPPIGDDERIALRREARPGSAAVVATSTRYPASA